MEKEHLKSTTEKINTPAGGMFVTLAQDKHGQLKYIELSGMKARSRRRPELSVMGGLCNKLLAYNIPIENLIELLEGHMDREIAIDANNIKVTSVPDGVALALKNYLERQKTEEETKDVKS